MKNDSVTFNFSNKKLILKIGDILSAPTDTIVNPANGGLSHGGGLAEQILNEAGEELELESNAIIQQKGPLNSGDATFTTAGRLPYKSVIHAVGPRMGEGNEARKISEAVTNCLILCNENNWDSIAFPAISTGIFSVPDQLCAQGFYQAITSWYKNENQIPDTIYIYLSIKSLPVFISAFDRHKAETDNHSPAKDKTPETGIINMSDDDISHLKDDDISDLKDDDINDWFK